MPFRQIKVNTTVEKMITAEIQKNTIIASDSGMELSLNQERTSR